MQMRTQCSEDCSACGMMQPKFSNFAVSSLRSSCPQARVPSVVKDHPVLASGTRALSSL
ncbi:hypothetical protein [Phaffia rhodozyma]|uniref:Uncharacterized protein n=1 Tax=Phaffia rhodozyma TaxID=264483 RepID=A0A0F7SFI4_PHARH|nr:hypothetical protein [Phaffia rhodozyma]